MKRMLAAITACLVIAAAEPAAAWGAAGHQLVGTLAEEQLNPNARAQLIGLLSGFGSTNAAHPDLTTGAVWADCVRDVSRDSAGQFHHSIGERTPNICKPFAGTPEADRMIAFAKRNWKQQCDYFPGCHAAYHFADVALQNSAYDPTHKLVGTSSHDIVGATQAAILVLQGKPCPAPFDIVGKREAALLLAHYVGDLHQPLHVGAVYLTDFGNRRNPGNNPEDATDRKSETKGGNILKFGSNNLHSRWDDVSTSFTVLSQVQAVPPTPGLVTAWPATWANETLVQARGAYANVTYSKVMKDSKGARFWTAQFADQNQYGKDRQAMQSLQVARAAARLAAIYNAVWP